MFDHRPSTFCTVCFVFVEPSTGGGQQLTMSLGRASPGIAPARRRVRRSRSARWARCWALVDPQLADVTVHVTPGDTLVLYTDGLTDAPADQAVPIDEVVQLLKDDGQQPTEQLADSIRALKRRRRPHGSSDDTVVLIVRFGDPSPAGDTPAMADVGSSATPA